MPTIWTQQEVDRIIDEGGARCRRAENAKEKWLDARLLVAQHARHVIISKDSPDLQTALTALEIAIGNMDEERDGYLKAHHDWVTGRSEADDHV